MTTDLPNFTLILPEMIMAGMICAILLIDVFLKKEHRVVSYLLTQATLIAVFVFTVCLFSEPAQTTFLGAFVFDRIASVLKIFIYITSFWAFWYSREYVTIHDMPRGEYYVLGLTSVLGMMVLVSAYSLLTIYLGIELMTLPLYALVAFRRNDGKASEAAIKYFVVGAIASGVLLYGMSILYGMTGSIDLPAVIHGLQTAPVGHHSTMMFALVFIIVAIGFKIGAVPFHMWVPDVYEGAPASVTALLGSAAKIAAFALLVRLLAETLGHAHEFWHLILIVLSIASMAIGNLLAIAQQSLRRMMAYSSIAHMGYMLLGFLAATQAGFASAMFYMVVYGLMSVGGFGLVALLSRKGMEINVIGDLKGLNQRNPWLAFMMLLLMFSMAGIPPTVGFFAKLGVLEALISVHLVWIAAVALAFAVIGAYYYIRVIKVMYFDKADVDTPMAVSGDMRVAITINGLVILLLGIFPSGLIDLCRSAF